MRRRLVLSTLAAVLLAVFLLGVPLAVAGDLLLVDQSKHDVQQRSRSLAVSVDHLLAAHETIDPQTLSEALGGSLRGHRLGATVKAPTGSWTVGQVPTGPAYTGEYQTANGVVVEVYVAQGDVRLDMVRAGAVVLAISVLAAAAAVALGVIQARRIARPLVQLAVNAGRLGAGESRMVPIDSGVAEVDQVAAELERSARRMAATLAAERDFTSDASHQLRTPLTALSMRLEEIAAAETVQGAQEEARIALVQVERLTQVVQDLLARSRRAHQDSTQAIAVDEVVQQQQQEWSAAFESADRALVVDGEPGLWVEATAGALAQVLATLLDNSLVHGAGRVVVTTRSAGTSVIVEVSDEGPGCHPSSVSGSSRAMSAAPGAPGSGWRSPATWRRPTAAGWSCCTAPRRPSRSSSSRRLGRLLRRGQVGLQHGLEDVLAVGPEPEDRRQPGADQRLADVVGHHALGAEHVAGEAEAGGRDQQPDRVDQDEQGELVVHRVALAVPEGPPAAADPGHDDGCADRDDRGGDRLVVQRTAAAAVHQQVVAAGVDDERGRSDDAELQELPVEDVDDAAEASGRCGSPRWRHDRRA